MATNIEKLAKLFSERNNQYHINITTGIIISTAPIKVKWGESIIVEEEDLIVTKTLRDRLIQVGDKVIMLPDNDFKIWYLIDKVG